MLKHSVKLRRYLLCGCVAAWYGMACVLHAVQNATELFIVVSPRWLAPDTIDIHLSHIGIVAFQNTT